MKPLVSYRPSLTVPFFFPAASPPHIRRFRRLSPSYSVSLPSHGRFFAAYSLSIRNVAFDSADQIPPSRPRTVYPGGYKRPKLTVPGLLLQIDADELMGGDRDEVIALLDRALAKSVEIVVLNSGASGGRLYEAACLLKSVVKGRAYLLITERVDIAAAVGASGVVLSDQGLPAIVARNTMMSSNSESVVLPLVARIVQDVDSALSATSSEGADLLLIGSGDEKYVGLVVDSLLKSVSIPVYVTLCSTGTATEGLQLLKSGAAGFVISLQDLKSSRDDDLRKWFDGAYVLNDKTQNEADNFDSKTTMVEVSELQDKKGSSGFTKLEEKEKQIIEKEKSVLKETTEVIQKAAPLMEEISLLVDAVSRIDEPFLMVIVGEFNSGKSTFINALLGNRYLDEGVIPTTNEITFLSYSELEPGELQRCQRHEDGQYVCYLPAPVLKDINIVDTPGTNVILQRQQRLTEEFVPRADLLVFVLSSDRPLTESEVAFLRYTQQWKKKFVFVLNKVDIYRDARELEEAISFVKENAQKLLNTENVILYPVSARSALEAKLSAADLVGGDVLEGSDAANSNQGIRSFDELEKFLYSFLDSSSSSGMERVKLKLETPIAIAERLLSAAESLVREDCLSARQDLSSADKIIDRTKDYAIKLENESISWTRQALALIDGARLRVIELIEATLQLSNFDSVSSYILNGESSATEAASSRVHNEILAPALSSAQKLLGEYVAWLQSNNTREGSLSKKSFENKWPKYANSSAQLDIETYESLSKIDEISLRTVQNLSAATISKKVDQNIRQVLFATVGGLAAAGLSASLLTSVLPTTMEDLLALGLCSAGGYVAISNLPYRRQIMIEKVNAAANALAEQLEEAMQKDLSTAVTNLESFVDTIGRPYREEAQNRLDRMLGLENELSDIRTKLQHLRLQIDNLHVSQQDVTNG